MPTSSRPKTAVRPTRNWQRSSPASVPLTSPARKIAYDVAAAMVGGGVLPELAYRAAVNTFGPHGAADLMQLVGLYCMVSVTLNAFDVPAPEIQNRPPAPLPPRSFRSKIDPGTGNHYAGAGTRYGEPEWPGTL
jgi:hypothetical protein